GFDTVSCYDDADGDGFGLTVASPRLDVNGACTLAESGVPGDCNDNHGLVSPATVLPRSPGSTVLIAACDDTDGDGFCLGGGVDSTADGDCEDIGEAMDVVVSGPVADCDETDPASSGSERLIDFIDNDNDDKVDEQCFGGGELIITEYFSNGDDDEDWFEVANLTWFDVFIDDWRLDDQPASGPTAQSLDFPVGPFSIPVGARAVLADSNNTTVTPLATWASNDFTLDDLDGSTNQNEGIRLRLINPNQNIDLLALVGSQWNFTAGDSAELSESLLVGALAGVNDPDNSNSVDWCSSVQVGGTPGTANACP
ncbi:MAG: hypothetical protein VX498_11765, partial [Myxococcota bacterium]|nr:hypothetical protein [Myxococcota bacterium]